MTESLFVTFSKICQKPKIALYYFSVIKYNDDIQIIQEEKSMKKLAIFLLAALLLGCLFGCSSNDASSDAQYVKDKGVLIVGITDFAPMDYQDADGEWIGFDADMAKAFAESLGVEVEFVEIEWDYKIMELDNKSIDVVWNGMTLTDEVTSAMECSDPYCNNAQVVIVSKDVADQYQTPDACASLKFAVEAGSAGENMAKELGFDYTPVIDQATALMEVAAGSADAAIIDKLMAAAMVGEGTNYQNLTYTTDLNEEVYGVGFRKGSDLAGLLNDFLKASMEDGSMQAIAEKYGVQASLIG